MKKGAILLSFSVVFLVAIVLIQYSKFHDGKLHIVICDVGQGDAIFIRTPKGSDILVDGGPNDEVLSCLSSNMPFWDRTVEIVILTHPDADHSTGMIDVIERYGVIQLITQKVPGKTKIFERLMDGLAEKKLAAKYSYQGDLIKEGESLALKILWPSKEAVKISEQNISKSNIKLNELSIVFELKYENFEGLFTGDAGSWVLESIASDVGDIDFLKVPHHGSKTGISSPLLSIIDPELAVISSGKENRYGHPSSFTLDLLNLSDVKTLRTDQEGEIEIVSDGEKYWVE